MATPSFSVIAEDDLTCPVCFELLRDPNTPKLLDCTHVCCAVCIQKMIEGGRRIVDCPKCCHVTPIPEEGVAAMKTNLRVRSLAEKHGEHSKKARAKLLYQKPSKKTPATAAMCPEHNIAIDFYCKKCNVAGCSLCMLYNHKGPHHDFDQVQNVHKEQKVYMEVMFNLAYKEIEESKQSVKDLTALQEEMERSLNTKEENIRKRVELNIKKAKEEGQTLIDKCVKNEQPKIDCVQQERERLQAQIEEVTGVVTATKNTIETTEKLKYVVKHSKIAQNVSSVLGKDTKGKVNIGMTKFVHGKAHNVKGNLGQVSQLRELKCELTQEFGQFQLADNITLTPNGLHVVIDVLGKQVYIYSQQKNGQYKKQSSIALSSKNTTKEPYGVAVTAEGKYLVARRTHVEVYSPLGKYEGTLNLRQGDGKGNENACAHGIKMMPDGRIVIADWVHSNLIILSKKETILGIIHPSIEPRCIALMPPDHIAVSDWSAGKVCVIDLESGREVITFDIPHANGLCYHEQTDCLLVGRCLELTGAGGGYIKAGIGVIEQYCSTTGRLVACIAEDLYYPYDMTFTPDGMLAVADRKTVKVYKVV